MLAQVRWALLCMGHRLGRLRHCAP
jgi:hypothetical protein